jgi:iron complex outermembrane receptor protein
MKKSIRLRARAFVPALSVLSLASVHSLAQTSPSALEQNHELNTVVVTASKFEEDVQTVPSFVTLITQKDIQESGVKTVNEAILRIGGVLGRPSLYGGNEYSLDLGGFGDAASSNMVIVIDGVPYKQGDASEIRLSSLAVDQVQRIEIQRGASTVLYGEGAIAGVINIITDASAYNTVKRNTATASYGLGSKNAKEGSVSAAYVNEGLRLNFAGLDRSSDGFRQNSKSTDKNTNLGIQFIADTTRLGVNYSNNKEFAQTPGGLTMDEFNRNPSMAQPDSLSNKTWIHSVSDSVGLFAEMEFAGATVRADAKQRVRDYTALAVQYSSPVNMAFKTVNDYFGLSATKIVPTRLGKYSYIVGIEKNSWRQDRSYPDSSDQVNLNSKASAIYLKNDLEIQEIGTRLSAGYRSEQLDKSQYILPPGGLFTPGLAANASTLSGWELGLSKVLTTHHTIYVRTSKGYRLPNIDEIGSATWDSVLRKPSPLMPQISYDKEIGWKYKLTNDTRIGVRAFQSDITNELIYDPLHFAQINLEPTQRRGIDLDVQHRLQRDLTVGAVLSLREAEFAKGAYEGKTIPMSPKTLLNVRTDWNFTAKQTIGASVNYVASQQIAGDFDNQNRMPSYAVTNLRYGYKLEHAELSLVVRNVFDKSYYSYATNAYDSLSNRYTSLYPDQRRSLMTTLRVSY